MVSYDPFVHSNATGYKTLARLSPSRFSMRKNSLFRRYAAATLALSLALAGKALAQERPAAATPAARGDAAPDSPPAQRNTDAKAADDRGEPKQGTAASEEPSDASRRIEDLNLDPRALKEALKGRPREIPDVLKIRNKRDYSLPSPRDLSKINDFLKGKPEYKETDAPSVETVVRNLVFSLSDVDALATTGKQSRDRIEQTLELAANNPQNIDVKFFTVYKSFLSKYLQQLLDDNLRVRINAMILLGKLKDEELVDRYVDLLNDPQQHEAVKYLAAKAIMMVAQRPGISRVEREGRSVAALLDLIQNGPVHPMTRRIVVQAFGAIGRPSRVLHRDVEVVIALLKVLRDPNVRRGDRDEAAASLGELVIPPELDYNFQYVGYEVAEYALDTAKAALEPPAAWGSDDLHALVFMVDAYDVVFGNGEKSLHGRAAQHPRASAKGDPVYLKALGQRVKALPLTAAPVFKPPQPGKIEDVMKRVEAIHEGLVGGEFKSKVTELENYLGSHKPRSPLVTPDSPSLGDAPELAKRKQPVPDGKGGEAAEQPAAQGDGEHTGGP
jgi:hypothetical protein